jgi:Rrf2 family protein
VRQVGRLSLALHALLHLSEHPEAMTSEALAACAGTNPVVVRRTFAGLREAGIVVSRKGRGGGWRLARPASEITLAQVQRALDERSVSAASVGLDGTGPGCLVESAVRRALDDALAEAARVVDERLARVTLADLAAEVRGATGKPFAMAPAPPPRG